MAALLFVAAWTSSASAHAQAGAKTRQQQEAELAKRDALIEELRRRVQALEERVGRGAASAPQKPADDAADEQLLARALERSLVRAGAVLLPSGQWEIEPSLRYDYTRRSGLAIVGGAVVSQDIRRETAMAGLGVRLGLPWSTQLEFALPYGRQRVETLTGSDSRSPADTGVGDVQLGASKRLVAEGERWPGLIGNLTWQSATGSSNLGVLAIPAEGSLATTPALGAGYDTLHARLIAAKRTDPLVFVGFLGHSFSRSTDIGSARVDPSDSNSAGLRAILAASPDVSLRAGFSMARSGDLRVNGAAVPGSGQTVAILELGTSWSLGRRTLLDVFVGAGLTDASPDFLIGIALPLRF